MHHQFRIFNPGHAVLDIGAGPNYNWTDLALKLVEDDKNSHIVISNDIAELTKRRPNNVFIKGDFIEEQVKTNIALSLKSRKFNTILIDVSPEFTGDLNDDGKYINDIIADTFIFAQTFL
jgi:23S rRNA U2552 (ribose-2'-O)-methylase RlmE/FtsJ